jgi:hypothetical protein
LNPFSKYIDCINCGNELTNISELAFRTPDEIECDFCGQEYPKLSLRIKKVKSIITTLFAALAVLVMVIAWQSTGFSAGLFALFPLFILYYFVLGWAIKRAIKF